ncbi:ATP-binding protein [Actinoplanes sp. URMC 104]|uniref:ATP-binding protein n=1 Tax=Actinoplanes sp. URMC 104 TaxID=3423409 RepID=UPI003F1DA45D
MERSTWPTPPTRRCFCCSGTSHSGRCCAPGFAPAPRCARRSAPLNDRGPLIGRDAELAALRTALDRSNNYPAVVVVAGPGGRGKTRLLTEALTECEGANPQIRWFAFPPAAASTSSDRRASAAPV